jgi:hypothetical protein
MPGKQQPGKQLGQGRLAFSTSQSPSGGSKVPRVDVARGADGSFVGSGGGIRPNPNDKPISGTRVPDWRK